MTVEVRFGKKTGVSAAWVGRIVKKTLLLEKAGAVHAAVLVTGDGEIRRINKKFLKHDFATDVISFGAEEAGFLGDVVVSTDTATRLARQLRIPYREELARYLVHGVLHLLGYDDKKRPDFIRMHRRQEAILKRVL